MDAVKLEGGSPARVEAARAIVESGVAVMGHVGLTPQSVSVIGECSTASCCLWRPCCGLRHLLSRTAQSVSVIGEHSCCAAGVMILLVQGPLVCCGCCQAPSGVSSLHASAIRRLWLWLGYHRQLSKHCA